MLAQYCSSKSVHQSVHHTLVLYLNYISSNFPTGAYPSFSECYCCYKILRETPSIEALNTQRWAKFVIFDWNRHSSWKRFEIGSPIGSHWVDQCNFQWPWKTGFEDQIFPVDFCNCIYIVWPRMTKLSMVTQMPRRSMFLAGQLCHHPQGCQLPSFLGDPYLFPYGLT